jgi:adenylate cyclase
MGVAFGSVDRPAAKCDRIFGFLPIFADVSEFLQALWQRRIVQFTALYLGVAWILLQVANQIEETLELPGWLDQAVLVLLALGLPIVVIVAWASSNRTASEPSNASADARDATRAAPAPTQRAPESPAVVTDRPSIAVLPFSNLSNDSEQEFLADGMTEDIITGLSCNRHLFVIARNSSFIYKGKSVDIRSVGREFGVRYVLEGSVRRIGDRLRTTAQLIEAESGSHLWAEKYDVPYGEIFELQDDVIQSITASLGAQLASAEYARAQAAKPSDLGAWEWLQRALALVPNNETTSPEGYRRAFEYLDRALEIDPDYAYARGVRAWFRFAAVVNGVCDDAAADFRRGLVELEDAYRVAGDDPLCLFYVGSAQLYAGRFDDAIVTLSRAQARNPNSADVLLSLGLAHAYKADFERAHALIDRAKRLAPSGGWAFAHEWYRGIVWSLEGKRAEAIAIIEECLPRVSGYGSAQLLLAACQAELGQLERAKANIARAARDNRSFTADRLPPMLAAHPDREMGASRMKLLTGLWHEVND